MFARLGGFTQTQSDRQLCDQDRRQSPWKRGVCRSSYRRWCELDFFLLAKHLPGLDKQTTGVTRSTAESTFGSRPGFEPEVENWKKQRKTCRIDNDSGEHGTMVSGKQLSQITVGVGVVRGPQKKNSRVLFQNTVWKASRGKTRDVLNCQGELKTAKGWACRTVKGWLAEPASQEPLRLEEPPRGTAKGSLAKA
jgi:hypothetical protein